MRFAALCLILTNAAAAVPPQAPDQARALVDKVLAAEAENRRRMVNYLFVETVTRRSFDREHRLVGSQSSAFEVIFIEGRPAFRRVSFNGRPLTQEEEQAEAARLRQIAEDRRRQPGIASPAEQRRRAHPFALFGLFHDFVMAGEDRMDGRDCWVLESRPRRGHHRATSVDEERIADSTGKFWIDKETLHRVRMDVTSRKASRTAKIAEFTSYRWGQHDGSVWLITSIHTVLPLPGNGKSVAYYEGEQLYSNYRRFTSESSVSAVEEVGDPMPGLRQD